MKNELTAIVKSPVLLFQVLFGIVVTACAEAEVMLVVVWGIILGFTIGVLPALSIAFGTYVLMRIAAGWISSFNEQINFHARCIRDKDLS